MKMREMRGGRGRGEIKRGGETEVEFEVTRCEPEEMGFG
jgi:hypothetical protein